MIYLTEIQEKLNNILNGEGNPTPFAYGVETVGFHLDHVTNANGKDNFIPVFISPLGGSVNPVPLLKQVNLNVPLTFYFPVRLKEEMFTLYGWLVEIFTGQILEYGKEKKKALSNVSVPTYGEIQDLDLGQFKKWVSDTYQMSIEVMEPYLSMQFTLYLQASGDEFIYGNSIKLKKVAIYQRGESQTYESILEDNKPVNIERVDLLTSEPAVQQIFSKTYGTGYPANAAYTKQLPLICKNTAQYRELFKIICVDKNPQSLIVKVVEEYPFTKVVDNETIADPLESTDFYFATNESHKITLGDLLGIQLTLTPIGDEWELPEETHVQEVVE